MAPVLNGRFFLHWDKYTNEAAKEIFGAPQADETRTERFSSKKIAYPKIAFVAE